MKLIAFILCALITGVNYGQITIKGTIRDNKINDVVIGARVKIVEVEGSFAVSNSNGEFEMNIDTSGSFTLSVEAFSYQKYEQKIAINGDVIVNIDMTGDVTELEEVLVEIENFKDNVESTQLGKVKLEADEIAKIPAVMGEVDVMKTLQLLPGVQSGGEGVSGLYVRGGGPDQNLILMDNATIYNTGHLFGFFSIFNNDAIEDVELYKGSMPAYFGGRLSSVLDFKSLKPNYDSISAKGGIGIISSRFTITGPIKKNKTAIFLSGRRTYIDVLTNPLFRNTDNAGIPYYFYDLNGKIEHKFSDKDKVYLSGYFGRDVASFELLNGRFLADFSWGNAAVSLGWNHRFSEKLTMDLTATLTDYKFQVNSQFDSIKTTYKSTIRDYGTNAGFKYFINDKNYLRFGLENIYHDFTPKEDNVEIIGSNSQNLGSSILNPKYFSMESAVYIDHQIDISDKLRIQGGLRYSLYNQYGPYNNLDDSGLDSDTNTISARQNVKTYGGIEPRVFGRYTLDSNSSLKASVVRANQYLHLLSLTGNSLPFDIWVPSTDIIQPQRGWQYSVGYFKNFLNDTLMGSIELFYRNMNNQIEYRQDYVSTAASDLERELVFGDGYAYGAELYFKKNYGRLTGWLGYTYSRTMRIFPDLNEGNKFPARYDRRHDLSLVGIYDINKKWSISGTFVYGTGLAVTIQQARYLIEGQVVNQYGSKNGFRMPAYHRFDIGVTHSKKKPGKRFQSSWTYSLYNVYNRKNAYLIYIDVEGDPSKGELKPQAKLVYIFPILPSVTWNFKF